MGQLENIVIKEDEIIKIQIKGRIDTSTAGQLEQVVFDALQTPTDLILDFEGVEYISSAGLRVLLKTQKKQKGDGKTLTITHVSNTVMEVLEVTGFVEFLTIA